MAISKALSALAGLARGGKTLIEREEKETSELSKLGLQKTLENIATAKKNHAESMKEFRDKMTGAKALQNWKYKDPETGVMKQVSYGQAIALIEATGGIKEANKALQDAEVAFKGEGEVGPIQYTSSGAIDKETEELISKDEEGVGVAPLSLAKGRGKRAMEGINKALDTLGIPKDGYQTPVGLPEVSGVQIVSTKNTSGEDVDSLAKGTLTKVIDGKEESVFSFVGDDRILYVLEGSNAVPVGESEKWKGGTFTPSVQKSEEVTPVSEQVDTYEDRYFLDNKTYQELAGNYRQKQAGIKVLGEAYNQMGPLATDETVYSGIAKLTGSLVKRAQIEFAGGKFVFGLNEEDEYTASEKIKEFDTFIENNKNITDPLVKAQVLEAIAGRAAVAYLKATGEDRFSDQDMRRGLAQFVASSPEAFLELARSNWTSQTSEARNMREALLQYKGFTLHENRDRYDEPVSKVIKSVADQYMPEELYAEEPYFLNEGYEEEFKKKVDEKPVGEEISVTLTIEGKSIPATYNPETNEVVAMGRSMSLNEALKRKYLTDQDIANLTKQ